MAKQVSKMGDKVEIKVSSERKHIEIKNIESLRDHAIETIRRLQMRSIDLEEASITSKLYENIISTLKSELEYNRMTKNDKQIPFLEGSGEVRTINISSKQMIEDARIIK